MLGFGIRQTRLLVNHQRLRYPDIGRIATKYVCINEFREFEIGCLIISARVLVTNLDHTLSTVVSVLVTVHSKGKPAELDIHCLTLLVVVVKTVLAYLELDSGSAVLDVEALVEVSGTVGSGHPALDDSIGQTDVAARHNERILL